jgi:hypothetical protein
MEDVSEILTDALSPTGSSSHQIRDAIRKYRDLQGQAETDLGAADELAFSFRESDEPDTLRALVASIPLGRSNLLDSAAVPDSREEGQRKQKGRR